jgi:N,N'-diacetylchitobiose phosphorylase
VQYGHFDDERKEYVIDRPDTPRSWSNYLGSTEYGAITTNNAGGYSFFRSAAQGRFTRLLFNSIPMDQPGRYFYLRDRDCGDYWSASWQPVGKDLAEYRSTCRHGTGYTVIDSEYSGIASESTYFVPRGRNFEFWILKLTNRGDQARKLSVFSYIEYASEWSVANDQGNLQFTQYVVKMDAKGNLIRHASLDHLPPDPDDFQNRDQGRHSFLGLVGAESAGFDTDREVFLGPYRTYANPIVVEQGKCTGSLAHGDNACGTMQVDLELAPGESKEFMLVMGVGEAEKEGQAVLAEYDTVDKARAALEDVKAFWHARLGRLTSHTDDPAFDSMVNVWNAYNCLMTFTWSRAASLVYSGERDGLAYRDTVQDFLGVLASIPDLVRDRLELMVTGQCSNGGAMPVVKTFAHRPGHETPPEEGHYRADDCLWLFNAVPAYVKETGELDFFDKVLPYADKGEATVLGHLRRALEFNLERSGANGLPCGLYADWNDCLRMGERGESLFVTFQVRMGLAVYLEISEMLKRDDEAAWARSQLADFDERIEKVAWDGDWFIRGIRDDGSIIGTKDDPEGSIFLNSQSWAVLSGAGTEEQRRRAMDMVHEKLATEFGIMVCTPPFEKTDYHVVRAVLFNSGMKENGGIFSHPQGWAVMSEAILGRGDRAYQYHRAYMPAAYNDRAEVRQVEPYVHCQSTHSPFSRRYGSSRLPWLTGTASWAYYSATWGILGIQPDYDGLRINPCLPSAWKEIRVTRHFRGRDFDITIRNGKKGKGVVSMEVNGKAIEGDLILESAFAETNQVVVQLA